MLQGKYFPKTFRDRLFLTVADWSNTDTPPAPNGVPVIRLKEVLYLFPSSCNLLVEKGLKSPAHV